MAWTYTGTPGAVPLDTVRFNLGDTVQAPTSLSDGEITYLLTQAGGDPLQAAASAADLWAARFAGLSASSKSVGDLSIAQDHAGAADRLTALARRLRARAGGMVPLIFDTRTNVFAVGQTDNSPGSGDDLARWF